MANSRTNTNFTRISEILTEAKINSPENLAAAEQVAKTDNSSNVSYLLSGIRQSKLFLTDSLYKLIIKYAAKSDFPHIPLVLFREAGYDPKQIDFNDKDFEDCYLKHEYSSDVEDIFERLLMCDKRCKETPLFTRKNREAITDCINQQKDEDSVRNLRHGIENLTRDYIKKWDFFEILLQNPDRAEDISSAFVVLKKAGLLEDEKIRNEMIKANECRSEKLANLVSNLKAASLELFSDRNCSIIFNNKQYADHINWIFDTLDEMGKKMSQPIFDSVIKNLATPNYISDVVQAFKCLKRYSLDSNENILKVASNVHPLQLSQILCTIKSNQFLHHQK